MTDCETNRSFAAVSRISAGTRSPADRRTRSPTTSSVEDILTHFPFLRTSTVEAIIPVRRSATRFARSSWVNRTAPLISSMHKMITTVVIFRLKLDANTTSVKKEMQASTNKMMVNGLKKARRSR